MGRSKVLTEDPGRFRDGNDAVDRKIEWLAVDGAGGLMASCEVRYWLELSLKTR